MLGQKNVRAEKWNPINNNQACLERYPLVLFVARPFFCHTQQANLTEVPFKAVSAWVASVHASRSVLRQRR